MLFPLASVLLATLGQLAAPAACSVADAPAGTFAVSMATARHDSTIRLSVCLATPAGRRVGSYHGEVRFPATMRVLAVESPRDGLRVDNALVPGKVSFAGAVPNGAGSDALLTVVLVAPASVSLPAARLHIAELNDTAGADVLGTTRVDSLADPRVESRVDSRVPAGVEVAAAPCGRRPRVGRPILERLVPSTASAQSPAAQVEIVGCGFDRTNVVIVGGTRIPGVVSTNDGTRLRVTIPLAAAGGGEVAPMPARAGPRSIVVSNAHGRSNALALVVQ
jgi:hypothetical protein